MTNFSKTQLTIDFLYLYESVGDMYKTIEFLWDIAKNSDFFYYSIKSKLHNKYNMVSILKIEYKYCENSAYVKNAREKGYYKKGD
jgi:hypothetical protein